MVQSVFIAEKPALGLTIATALASMNKVSMQKSSGYIVVGEDIVTWTRGHAYTDAPPEKYKQEWGPWSLETLPMIPTKWKQVPNKDMGSFISAISSCLGKRPKEIYHVGDAEREGQLIVDEILVENGIDPFQSNVKRVWLHSMTAKGVETSIKEAFPNKEKQHLYRAAVCRKNADWLHGINLTRCFAILVSKSGVRDVKIRVGRVQTPTLKLIVDRDREIENFKPTDHFIPSILFEHKNGTFTASYVIPDDSPGLDPENRLVDKNIAEEIVRRVMGKTGKITSIQKTPKSTPPPLAFSINTIQQACFRKFGLQLEETNEIIQSLYDKKLTSYPRTESEYLPKSLLAEEAPTIMSNLSKISNLSPIVSKADMKLVSPVWNDAKLTDHYGIVPTIEATAAGISGLSANERKVFDLIAKTFISQFYPFYKFDSTSVEINVEKDKFKATGKRVTDKGWKVVFGEEEEEDEEKEKDDEKTLPEMAKGDDALVKSGNLGAKRTKPPAYFDDASIIEAMTSIHKFVKNQKIKQILRESSGIGTAATRGAIINKLIALDHIQRKKKGKKTILTSTKLGRDLIDLLPQEISSADLTAYWEEKLKQIELGNLEIEVFLKYMADSLNKTIGIAKEKGVSTNNFTSSRKLLPHEGEKCPSCGKGTLRGGIVSKPGPNKGRPYVVCSEFDRESEAGCKHFQWADEPQKKSDSREGKTCPVCGKGVLKVGIVSKPGPNKGRSFLICSEFSKENDTSCKNFEWLDETGKTERLMPGENEVCPKCGKGKMIRRHVTKEGPNKGKAFLVCNNWRAGDSTSCDNRWFPDDGKSDYSKKKTFTSKSGASAVKKGFGDQRRSRKT